jgi:two-component system cell cycle sensor histidine kinase/response regulator CckA
MSDDRSRGKQPEWSVERVPDGIHDGTAEKRREPDVAQNAYLQQLVDQIPAFLWVIDRDLIVRRIEGGRPMLETLDRDRLAGLPMAEVTAMGSSADDIELSVAMHRRVLEGATERYRATWKGITLEARILNAAERAASITRQLLAFSRQQAPAAVRLDLVEVVHDLTGMLRALLPATIELRVSPDRGASPIFVLADRGQLDQVVMNLAVNARDAMPNGGILSVNVHAATTAEGAHTAVLEVHDNGAGMSREVQAHVFEPFFTTKEPGRGTGLGLATVYGIVRQHSGTIEIASVVGLGTGVTVRLPMAAPGAEAVTDESERVEHDDRGRVLVVEDETQVREVAERFLRRAGYDVLTASDAATALASLTADGPFDLVLTDSAMPGMRGEDLAAQIRHVQPGLPVILMSGYADSAKPVSGAVAAFIQKPFTMPALLAEVRRVIARDRPPSE